MSKKQVFQYYYSQVGCGAKTAFHKDCKCWHDEGTGERKEFKHDGVEGDYLAWRIKPSKRKSKNA